MAVDGARGVRRRAGARWRRLYQERRDLLCDGLTARGWPVARPRGTMFVWARIPRAFRAMGSLAFAELLVREAGVAVSPGVGFTAGPGRGRGTWADEHVRFALVQPEERIAAALDADRDRHGRRRTADHRRGGDDEPHARHRRRGRRRPRRHAERLATAAELWEALPIESAAQVWGDEVYFTVPVERGPEDPQATVELGAVGYWPPGSAVCLFFGQQPVSPVNLVGSIEGDPSGPRAVHDGQPCGWSACADVARGTRAPARRRHAPGRRPSRTRRTVSATRRARVSARFASAIQ